MDVELRDRWLARTTERIVAAGLRAGAARSAVIEALAREGQCLLTIQEILNLLPRGGPGSSASVYRAIDELFELGLLHRLDGRDGVARYEIVDPSGHHHHFVNEDDGGVEAFCDEPLERAIAAAARRLGVELTGHDVVLRGRRRRS